MEETFKAFLVTVDSDNQDFVTKLHQYLIQHGCTYTIKEAKSGYVVSYLNDTKHTLATYIFRKTGIKLRMYLEHIAIYQDMLETLPKNMKKDIQKASVCKRLVDPNDCNPKCSMGYTFAMEDNSYHKCRFMAFMCNLSQENNGYIKQLIEKELTLQ